MLRYLLATVALAGTPELTELLSPDFSGKFLPVPLMRQARSYTCGASATQGMLAYFGEDFREGQLETILESHAHHGTTVGNIIEFWTAMGEAEKQHALRKTLGKGETVLREIHRQFVPYRFRAFGRRELFQPQGPPAPDCPPAESPEPPPSPAYTLEANSGWDAVKEALDDGQPVLVVMQAWAKRPEDYGERWDSGHYAVVVGYDAHRVYFMDPSTTGNYAVLPRDEFFRRWYDYEGYLSPSTGERCPGGYAFSRFGLAVTAGQPTRYRWSAVVPME